MQTARQVADQDVDAPTERGHEALQASIPPNGGGRLGRTWERLRVSASCPQLSPCAPVLGLATKRMRQRSQPSSARHATPENAAPASSATAGPQARQRPPV